MVKKVVIAVAHTNALVQLFLRGVRSKKGFESDIDD
jgi:hypothetical protein